MNAKYHKMGLQRMRVLLDLAVSNARTDPVLSRRQAALARRIATRYRIRMPYELRLMFCKKCKSFIAPGAGSRVRLGRSQVRSVRVTCLFCGHIYHKIMPQ